MTQTAPPPSSRTRGLTGDWAHQGEIEGERNCFQHGKDRELNSGKDSCGVDAFLFYISCLLFNYMLAQFLGILLWSTQILNFNFVLKPSPLSFWIYLWATDTSTPMTCVSELVQPDLKAQEPNHHEVLNLLEIIKVKISWNSSVKTTCSSLFSFSWHQPQPEHEERLCGGRRGAGQHHGLQPTGDWQC